MNKIMLKLYHIHVIEVKEYNDMSMDVKSIYIPYISINLCACPNHFMRLHEDMLGRVL